MNTLVPTIHTDQPHIALGFFWSLLGIGNSSLQYRLTPALMGVPLIPLDCFGLWDFCNPLCPAHPCSGANAKVRSPQPPQNRIPQTSLPLNDGKHKSTLNRFPLPCFF